MSAGARFFKTDLQVHTPRDPQWSGERPVTHAERMDYADEFVAACRARGLDAVAITDHHDVALVDYIRNAAERELDASGQPLPKHQRLVVFPGLELSLSVCQALLILSADFPTARLSTVLNLLSIDPADDSAVEGEHPKPLPLDLKALHELLDGYAWLRGEYIVLPNVTPKGHKTLIRKGFTHFYRDMPCVGGYVDGGAQITGGARRILEGEDREWGSKRIAVIRTSDSRERTFKRLGAHATWIKWTEPTAEALRQACLAQESRISLDEPRIPSVVVTGLSVSNSVFMGPINLCLNPRPEPISEPF